MLVLRGLKRRVSGVVTLAVFGIAALGAFAVFRASGPEGPREVQIAFGLIYGFLAGMTLQVIRKTMPHGNQVHPWEFYAVIGGFLTVFAGGPVLALVSILCGWR